MSDSKVIQYLGFSNGARGREYAFSVHAAGAEPREYTLTITNDAFARHLARYQDGPDICSLRLHQELAAGTNDPATTHFGISDAELTAYDARRLKPRNHLNQI